MKTLVSAARGSARGDGAGGRVGCYRTYLVYWLQPRARVESLVGQKRRKRTLKPEHNMIDYNVMDTDTWQRLTKNSNATMLYLWCRPFKEPPIYWYTQHIVNTEN